MGSDVRTDAAESPGQFFPVQRSLLAVDALAARLEGAYGLRDVRCRLIKGTIRDTCLVTSRDGPHILSIYRHGRRSIGEINAELDLLDHLVMSGVPVAPARRRPTGERLLEFDAPEGKRWAALFTYIPGRHLSRQAEPEPARLFGRAIAQVHAVADTHAVAFRRPRIGPPELLRQPIEALASVVTHRPAVIAFLRETASMLYPRIASLPTGAPGFGLIHGDVIPSNAQVTPDGEVAVLAFDFSGYGWRAYDIATFLGEVQFWGTSAAVADAFVAGYEEIRRLEEWERSALPLFEAARHICSLGIPAINVDEWGSAYLADGLVDRILSAIRASIADLG